MSEKQKKVKKVLTPQEKKTRAKHRGKIAGVVILSLVIVFGLFMGTFAIVNVVGTEVLMKTARSFEEVDYGTDANGKSLQLVPTKDANDGYWTFTTDEDLNIMQLTDIHIGAGFGSFKRDSMALNAVAAMITAEKPDLVVITGDLVYPVPVQAGTFNNKSSARVLSTLMETLGVYWTLTFGNHDTESYSMFDREDIADFYTGEANLSRCLFQKNPKGMVSGDGVGQIYGFGNSIIKVKNTDGKYTQAIATIDSNAYMPGDSFGVAWDYDDIHTNEVEWYKNEMIKLNAANGVTNKDDIGTAQDSVKSLAFFHIPLSEMQTAYAVVRNEGLNKDKPMSTDGKVEFHFGVIREKDPYSYCGQGKDMMLEDGKKVGLQGVFTGHDHLNNLSVTYQGVRMTYGMSIDYLAYMGIYKDGSQRGCTMITVKPDGTFDVEQFNYYKAKNVDGTQKYPSKYPKEQVTFEY